MTYVIEMRRSPDITEEEIRRRLATCYSLLFELAEKHKSDASDDGCEPHSGASGDRSGTDCQEPVDTRTGPGANGRLSNGQEQTAPLTDRADDDR